MRASASGALRSGGAAPEPARHSRIRRERAEKLLSATIGVVLDINADEGTPLYVRKLSVFGPYLGGETVLSELSLAYELGARREPRAGDEGRLAACLKLAKGMRIARHTDIDSGDCAHRVIFEISA